MSEDVLLAAEPAPGVRLLTLNRPEVRNALDVPLLDRLRDELRHADADPRVGCIVLAGAGSAFCSGGDISVQVNLAAEERGWYLRKYAELGALFERLEKPVIAAVHGYALAGGFELAAACDIRVVAREAVLGVEDAEVGLTPTTGLTWTLQRIVGRGNAAYLVYTAERIDGARALEIGLAQELVEDVEGVVPRAVEVATAIAAKPGRAVALSRKAFALASHGDHAAAVEYETRVGELTFADPSSKAAFEAFLARRGKRATAEEAQPDE
jgi:enoyl-CoA hydratase/carnithine racemase